MPNLKLGNILSKNEKIQLGNDYQNIILNEQLHTMITLCKVSSGVYDPTTGIMTESWTRAFTYAIRGNYETSDIAMGAGMFQLRESGESLTTYPLGSVFFLVTEEDYLTNLGGDVELEDRLFESRYKDGGVSVTNGNALVTGIGTKWLTNLGKGNWIRINYESTYYEVKSVASDTSLTLEAVYGGSTKTYQPYEAYTEFIVMMVQKDPTSLLRKIHCRRVD